MTRPAQRVRQRSSGPAIQTEVWVVLHGEDTFAGTLYSHRRRGTESATFSYAPTYLANSERLCSRSGASARHRGLPHASRQGDIRCTG